MRALTGKRTVLQEDLYNCGGQYSAVQSFSNLSGLVAGHRGEKDYCFEGTFPVFLSCGWPRYLYPQRFSLEMVITVLSIDLFLPENHCMGDKSN